MKKVLLTTAYCEDGGFDFYRTNNPHQRLVSLPLDVSPGLRFLRENIPGITILEYPTWREYCRVLARGWDVVGFSFTMAEANRIALMARRARAYGDCQIWAGNYGALTPGFESLFDRTFLGHAEVAVAQALGYDPPVVLRHPAMSLQLWLAGVPTIRTGLLSTTRGCRYACDFCQAQVLAGATSRIPLDSIDRVLREYRRSGIRHVTVLDEAFGSDPAHAEEVTRLFAHYRMLWNPNVRLDTLLVHLDTWIERGLEGVKVGIETFDEATARQNHIGRKSSDSEAMVRALSRAGVTTMAFLIIGFEDDTPDSAREGLNRLYALPIDIPAPVILTPFPQTRLWSRIVRDHGITDYNAAHYDLAHLVWAHPHFPPGRIESLRARFQRQLRTTTRLGGALMKAFGRAVNLQTASKRK